MKIKVKEFNDLPIEERHKIIYYTNIEKIITIKQVLKLLERDIGENQRQKLDNWRHNIENYQKAHYEVEDID